MKLYVALSLVALAAKLQLARSTEESFDSIDLASSFNEEMESSYDSSYDSFSDSLDSIDSDGYDEQLESKALGDLTDLLLAEDFEVDEDEDEDDRFYEEMFAAEGIDKDRVYQPPEVPNASVADIRALVPSLAGEGVQKLVNVANNMPKEEWEIVTNSLHIFENELEGGMNTMMNDEGFNEADAVSTFRYFVFDAAKRYATELGSDELNDVEFDDFLSRFTEDDEDRWLRRIRRSVSRAVRRVGRAIKRGTSAASRAVKGGVTNVAGQVMGKLSNGRKCAFNRSCKSKYCNSSWKCADGHFRDVPLLLSNYPVHKGRSWHGRNKYFNLYNKSNPRNREHKWNFMSEVVRHKNSMYFTQLTERQAMQTVKDIRRRYPNRYILFYIHGWAAGGHSQLKSVAKFNRKSKRYYILPVDWSVKNHSEFTTVTKSADYRHDRSLTAPAAARTLSAVFESFFWKLKKDCVPMSWMCHSMGCYVTELVAIDHYKRKRAPMFEDVMMVAADVRADVFTKSANDGNLNRRTADEKKEPGGLGLMSLAKNKVRVVYYRWDRALAWREHMLRTNLRGFPKTLTKKALGKFPFMKNLVKGASEKVKFYDYMKLIPDKRLGLWHKRGTTKDSLAQHSYQLTERLIKDFYDKIEMISPKASEKKCLADKKKPKTSG